MSKNAPWPNVLKLMILSPYKFKETLVIVIKARIFEPGQ